MEHQSSVGGHSECFGRMHRVRCRSDYRTAYDLGQRSHGRLTVVFIRRREDDGPWRLGMTATRKLGGAVRRNRLRRQGREIFRRWDGILPAGWDIVLNFKHSAVTADYADLRSDVLNCLKRMGIDPEMPAGGASPAPNPATPQ